MSSPLARVVLSSFVVLAAAAGVWLLTRSSDAGSEATGTAGPGPLAETPASRSAAVLEAKAPASPAAPIANAARTQVADNAPASAAYRLTGRLLTADRTPVAVEVGLSVVAGGDFGVGADVPALRDQVKPAQVTRSAPDGRFELVAKGGVETNLRLLDEAWYLRGKDAQTSMDALRIASLTGDRDLGDIVLGRSGRVAGVVQNEVGKPLAGVQVRVSNKGDGIVFDGPAGGAVTDAAGKFARQGLRPGNYTISTASPDYLPGSMKIELGEGDVRDNLVIALRAGHIVAGIVVDDQGTPLAGMKVAADRARQLAPGVEVQSSNTAEATTTDASGRFVLRGLDAPTVNIDGWGPGHVRGQVANVASGTTDLVVKLARFGGVAGHVVDTTGAPVAGSRVMSVAASSSAAPVFFDGGQDTKTDTDGAFLLDQVRPGACRIVAEGDDHLRVESAPVDVQPGLTRKDVRLVVKRGAQLAVKVTDAAGQPVVGARVAVTEAATPQADAAGVRSRVVRAQRRVDSSGAGNVMLDDQSSRGNGVTDATGVARIGGLAPGRVVANVTHDRHAPVTSAPVVIPEAGRADAAVTMVAGGFVHLQALDAAGDALPHASYKLQGPFGDGGQPKSETGRCDAKGLATVGPLPPGRWKARLCMAPRPVEIGTMSMVLFGDQGHEFAETETIVDVIAEQTTALTLTQPQLTTLRGTVRDSKGQVSGAQVKLVEGTDALLSGPLGGGPGSTTDGSGAFEIKNLPAGKYTLRYGYPDAIAMSEEPLEIVAGQALLERALVLRTGTIKLIVHSEDGEPVVRARVTLERAGQQAAPGQGRSQVRMVAVMRVDNGNDGGGSTTSITAGGASATTDTAGEVELARVPEGQYTLRIEHPQHVVGRKPDVKVLNDATVDLGTVKLAVGGELRGRVTGADGANVAFAHVEVTPLPSGEARMETAMNGSYRITGLAPGSYRVHAETVTGPPGAGDEPRRSAPCQVDLGRGERKSLDLLVK